MIIGQSITYLSEDQKIVSCEDFSFKGGVTYLPYRQKEIFSILSLSDAPFASGSLSIDGVQLTPTGFVGGQAKAIKLDVSDTGSLFLIFFYKGTEQEADSAFQKLTSELKALKFPAKTEESKKDKAHMLMTVLSQNPISYILIDLNDPLVQKNKVLWETTFLDYKGNAFFLSQDPEKEIKTIVKGDAWSKDLYLPYRIPLALTSFLAIFSACYAQSLRIQASSKWGFVLAVAIFFLFANIVIGWVLSRQTISKKPKQSSLASFEFRSIVFNVIGLIAALLSIWLFSSKEIFFVGKVLAGAGLALITLIGVTLLFAQAVIGHISVRHQFDSSFKSK